MDDTEQYSRCNSLRITGVPEPINSSNENERENTDIGLRWHMLW